MNTPNAVFPPDLPPLPPRGADAHKGTMGRVLVVGGSPGMSGAVVLACRAALRSGAGLVTAALPASIRIPFEASCLEGMCVALPDGPDGAPSGEGIDILLPHLERADAVVLGPGIGRSAATEPLFSAILDRYKGPHVVDADGLWHLAQDAARLAAGSSARVLTPHEGEFARLADALGLSRVPVDEPLDDGRDAECRAFAARVPGVLLRKGPGTRIASGESLDRNPTGNPGLAAGGSGDVLSGILGALLARGDSPHVAARRGAWLHGLAGDIARDERGEESMIASDVIEALPGAFLAMAAATDGGEGNRGGHAR